MKVLRILGYVGAFGVILLVVSYAVGFVTSALEITWPEMLRRAIIMIITWAIFWVAVWRPLGRRAQQQQQQQPNKKRQQPNRRRQSSRS